MLAFFRRIRQALLNDGAVPKYLLYALGEIALVVIGILIALQINGWNEWRKDRESERIYLQSLSKELNSNFQLLENHILFDSNQYRRANMVLDYFTNDLSNDPLVEVLVSLEFTGWIFPVIYEQNVWNEMQNTGNIILIRNQKLKEVLTAIYQNFKFYKELEVEFQSYNLGYRRLTGDVIHANIRKALVVHDGGVYPQNISQLPDCKKLKSTLKNLKGLSGYLVDIQRVRGVSKNLLKDYSIQMKEVQTLLNEELKVNQ